MFNFNLVARSFAYLLLSVNECEILSVAHPDYN